MDFTCIHCNKSNGIMTISDGNMIHLTCLDAYVTEKETDTEIEVLVIEE